MTLKFLTVAARAKHTATVIFLHGLGDSGYGWQPIAEMFSKESSLGHIKWVLPHAPERLVTINMGAVMPAWFDIKTFDRKSEDDGEDEVGMLESSKSLNELISAEVNVGIPSERVILGGFSQGGAMTLFTGLTNERKLGGLVVLSGRLALKAKTTSLLSPHAKSLPIFWGHGESDNVVKYGWGLNAAEYLTKQFGISKIDPTESPQKKEGLVFHSYPRVQHSTSLQELEDLKAWLSVAIPSQATPGSLL